MAACSPFKHWRSRRPPPDHRLPVASITVGQDFGEALRGLKAGQRVTRLAGGTPV